MRQAAGVLRLLAHPDRLLLLCQLSQGEQVALGMGRVEALVLVAAMLAGMALFEWLQRRRLPHAQPA